MPKQHTHSSAAGSGEKQERVLNLYKVKRWLKVTQVWIGGDCSECRVTERGRTGKCYFRVYMFCGWSFTTLEPGKNWCLTTWGIVKIVFWFLLCARTAFVGIQTHRHELADTPHPLYFPAVQRDVIHSVFVWFKLACVICGKQFQESSRFLPRCHPLLCNPSTESSIILTI